MELIPINPQKLKIILSSDDMRAFDITSTELDYSTEKTRKALTRILETAKIEAGFDADNDKLYIEVFPSLDGGCEMFLTKHLESESQSKLHFKRKCTTTDGHISANGSYIASSENIEDIITLCIRLTKEGFDGSSSLYTKDNRYSLRLAFKNNHTGFSTVNKKSFSFIFDYCDIKSEDKVYSAYLNEHAKTIIKENAVKKIQNFFGD